MAKINIDLGFNIDSKNLNKSIDEIQKRLKQMSSTGSLDGLKLSPKELQLYQQELNKVYAQTVKLRDQTSYGVANSSSWDGVQKAVRGFNELNQQMGVSAKLAQTATMEQGKMAGELKTTKKALFENVSLSDKLAENFKQVASWSVSAIAFRELTKQLRASVDYAKELDVSLSAIRTVTGKGFKESQRMAQDYNQMAKDLSTTTKDITNASVEFYRQGKSDSEVRELAEVTTKAAAISGEEMANTSSMLTASLNGFQLAADAAEGVVDKFAALDAASATSFKEMSYALTKVASAAHNAEISIDETLGMIATVSSVTREAPENIGTSFKTIFARMRGTTDDGFIDDSSIQILNKVDQALASVGIKQREWSGEMKSSFDVLEELGGQWGELDKQTQAYLATQIAGSRQQSRFFAMMDNWDLVSDSIQTAETSAGKANEQFERHKQGAEASAQRTKAAMEELKNMAFDPSALIAVNETIQKVLGSLQILFKHIKPATMAFALLGRTVGGQLHEAFVKFNGPFKSLMDQLAIRNPNMPFIDTVEKLGNMASTSAKEINTLEGKLANLKKHSSSPAYKSINHILGGMSTKKVDINGKEMSEMQNLVTDYRMSDKSRDSLGKEGAKQYDAQITKLAEQKEALYNILQLEQERIKLAETLTTLEKEQTEIYGEDQGPQAVEKQYMKLQAERAELVKNIATMSEREAELRTEETLRGKLTVEQQKEYNKLVDRRAGMQTKLADKGKEISDYAAEESEVLTTILSSKKDIVAQAHEAGIVQVNEEMTRKEIVRVIEEHNGALRLQGALHRDNITQASKELAIMQQQATTAALKLNTSKALGQVAAAGVQYAGSRAKATTKYEKQTADAQLTGQVVSAAASVGFAKAGATLGVKLGASLGPVGAAVGATVGTAAGAITGAIMQKSVEKAKAELEALQERFEGYQDFLAKNSENMRDLDNFEDFDYLRERIGSLNENLGLSADSYAKFIEQNARMAEMFPELIQGYDAENNAIMDLSMTAEDYRKKLSALKKEQAAAFAADFPEQMKANKEKIEELTSTDDYKSNVKDIEKVQKKLMGGNNSPTELADLNKELKVLQSVERTYKEQIKAINAEAGKAAEALLFFTEGFTDMTKEAQSVASNIFQSLSVVELFEGDVGAIQQFSSIFGEAFSKNEDQIMRVKARIDSLGESYSSGRISQSNYTAAQERLTDEMLSLMGVTNDMLRANPELYQTFAESASVVGSLAVKNRELLETYKSLTLETGLTVDQLREINKTVEAMSYKELSSFVKMLEQLNKSRAGGMKELIEVIPKLSKSSKVLLENLNMDPKTNAELEKTSRILGEILKEESGNMTVESLEKVEQAMYALRASMDFQYDMSEVSDYTEDLNKMIATAKDSFSEVGEVMDVVLAGLKMGVGEGTDDIEKSLAMLSKQPELLAGMTIENNRIIFDNEQILGLITRQSEVYDQMIADVGAMADNSVAATRTQVEMLQVMENARKMHLTTKDDILAELRDKSSQIYKGMADDAYEVFSRINDMQLDDKVVTIITQVAGMSPMEMMGQQAHANREYKKAQAAQSGVEEFKKLSGEQIAINQMKSREKDIKKQIDDADKAEGERVEQEIKNKKNYEKSLKNLDKQLNKIAKSEEELKEKSIRLDQTDVLNKNIKKWDQAERSVQGFNRELEHTRFLMGELEQGDFVAREGHLQQTLKDMMDKDAELKALFNEYADYQPVNEQDAKEVAGRVEKIGEEMITNMREVKSVQKEIEANHLASMTGQTDYNTNELKDWDTVNDSNKEQLSKGFASGTGHQLALSYKRNREEDPVEQKQRENRELIAEEKNYRAEIKATIEEAAEFARELQIKEYEENKARAREEAEELEEQRKEALDQIRELHAQREKQNAEREAADIRHVEAMTALQTSLKEVQNLIKYTQELAESNNIMNFFDNSTGKWKENLEGMDERFRTALETDQLFREATETIVSQLAEDAGGLANLDADIMKAFAAITENDDWKKVIKNVAQDFRDEVGHKEDMREAVKASLDYAAGKISFSDYKEIVSNLNKEATAFLGNLMETEMNPEIQKQTEAITEKNPIEFKTDFKAQMLFDQATAAIKEGHAKDIFTIEFESKLKGFSKADQRTIESTGSSSTWRSAIANSVSFFNMNAYAEGTDGAVGGPSLVGEEAPELAIYPDGTQKLLGKHGPELVDIPRGTKIYNANDTKQVLRYTGKGIDGQKLTAYASGTHSLGDVSGSYTRTSSYSASELISALTLLLAQDRLIKAGQIELNDKLDKLIEFKLEELLHGDPDQDIERGLVGVKDSAEEYVLNTPSDPTTIELIGPQAEIDEKALALGILPNSTLIAQTEETLYTVYDENKEKMEEPFLVSSMPDMEAIGHTDQAFADLYTNLINMTNETAMQISQIVAAVISNMQEMAAGAAGTMASTATSAIANAASVISASGSSGASSIQGSDTKEKVWNFLKSKGFTDEAAAGVMGNLQQESGIDPTKKQYGGGPGRGLMQWEIGSDRFKGLEKLAKERGTTWDDLGTQLDWFWHEFNNERTAKSILNGNYNMAPSDLMKMKDVYKAMEIFEMSYERAGKKHHSKRGQYANQYYSKYKAYEKGVRDVPVSHNALVGERGPEIIQKPDGTREIRGQNGPEYVYLEKGSSVVNANETRSYLSQNRLNAETEDPGPSDPDAQRTAQPRAITENPRQTALSTGGGGTDGGIADLGMTYRGKVQYVWGAANIDGGKADCSGFVSNLLNKVVPGGWGRDTTHTFIKKGTAVSRADVQKNDLLLYRSSRDSKNSRVASHIGIARDNKTMVHIGSSPPGVVSAPITESTFITARRIPGAGHGGTSVGAFGGMSGLGVDATGVKSSSREDENRARQLANESDREVITEQEFSSVAEAVEVYYGYKKGTLAFKTMLANVRRANEIPAFFPISSGVHLKLPKVPTGTNFINGFEMGGQVDSDQYALYGEAGYELGIFPDGTQKILGAGGPEVGFLPKGTLVVNHENTKKIMSENQQSFVKGYESPNQKLVTQDDRATRDLAESVDENTKSTKTLTNELSKTLSSIGELGSFAREGIEQRNFIENEIFNNLSKRDQGAEWSLVKQQIKTLEDIAKEQGLADMQELLTGTVQTSEGLIINNRDSLIDPALIELVNGYEKNINKFVKTFGFESSKLTGAIIDAGEKIDSLTQQYTMTNREKALREDYNRRARDFNERTKKILGYENSIDYVEDPYEYNRTPGQSQYAYLEKKMTAADYANYLDNKNTYAELVGNRDYKKVMETLKEDDKTRLENAMAMNKVLRERYKIEEDLIGRQEMKTWKTPEEREVDRLRAQMSFDDFEKYIDNKELYEKMVGGKSLAKVMEELNDKDKERLQLAMDTNKALRVQYGIIKDIISPKEMKALGSKGARQYVRLNEQMSSEDFKEYMDNKKLYSELAGDGYTKAMSTLGTVDRENLLKAIERNKVLREQYGIATDLIGASEMKEGIDLISDSYKDGIDQYISMKDKMTPEDFDSYLRNKRLYATLIGDGNFTEMMEKLTDWDKDRLQYAMQQNKELREQYKLGKDIMTLADVEKGHSIVQAEGVDAYLDLERRMGGDDFDEYMGNKALYAELVGTKTLAEAYKTLEKIDRDRLEAAIRRNQVLRFQYGIEKDIINAKDIEAGKNVIKDYGGNPLSDPEYQKKQLEALKQEDFRMLYYNLLSDEARLREQVNIAQAEYDRLLRDGSGPGKQEKLGEQEEVIAKLMGDLNNTLSEKYEVYVEFTISHDLEKFEKTMADISEQANQYSQLRQEDMINVMQYMKQELDYTEGSVGMWETVIETQKNLLNTLELGSAQWIKANEDLEEYEKTLKGVNHEIEIQKKALMDQSFGVFEKILERIQKRIENIIKIDDIKDLTASFHELQLELNSINGIIDYSAMGTEADLSMVQGMIGELIESEGKMIGAVESIEDLKKKIANMPKETEADRELIAATIMQSVGMTEAQLEQLAKHQSNIKNQIREVTKEYSEQTKAYDDLVKLKEDELEELDERNKEEQKYNDMIKLRMQLLRALDETEHRYITGRGTVEYRADLDKVNDIKLQMSETTRQDSENAEKERIQDEIKELRKEQEEKARRYELQINTLEASLEQSQKTSEIMQEMQSFLSEWPNYVFGMTDLELQRLEESITGFGNGVIKFDEFNASAFGAGGFLDATLTNFSKITEETFVFFNDEVRDTMIQTGESLSEVLEGTGKSIYEVIQTEHVERMKDNEKLFTKATEFFDKLIDRINKQVEVAKKENKDFAEGATAKDPGVKFPDVPLPGSKDWAPAAESKPIAESRPAKKEAGQHVVKKGDNLWNIVKQHYGLGSNAEITRRIKEVVAANPHLPHLQQSNGNRININDKITLPRFNTGGYTGDWTGNHGKLAILDKKELVLKEGDTQRFLEAIREQRDMQVREDRMAPLFAALMSSIYRSKEDQSKSNRPIIIENIELPGVQDAPRFVDELGDFLNQVERNQG